jgi:hypothetical protein
VHQIASFALASKWCVSPWALLHEFNRATKRLFSKVTSATVNDRNPEKFDLMRLGQCGVNLRPAVLTVVGITLAHE